MNTNFRALLFGAAVAAALTITLDTVTAAEPVDYIRLDAVSVTAHRDAFDAEGLEVVRLEPVVVTAHKNKNGDLHRRSREGGNPASFASVAPKATGFPPSRAFGGTTEQRPDGRRA